MTQTPTTEDVRKSYATYRSENLRQTLKRAKAFDAWLAAHDAAVASKTLEEAAKKVWCEDVYAQAEVSSQLRQMAADKLEVWK